MNGYAGLDDYSYQDFKWVAKRNINFLSRGSNYVSITIPVPPEAGGSTTLCKNINVQLPPTITKSFLGKTTAAVDYTADAYSMAAITGTPVTITFRYRGDFYGRSGTAATVSTNKFTGTATVNLSVPGGDIYNIDAVISDGLHTESVFLGSINKGDNGNPNCPRCNKN